MTPTHHAPLIVGGCHRSGTTPLRRLLNGHPNIFCPPEIKFFTDLLGQFPDDPLRNARLGRTISALGLPRDLWLDQFGAAFVGCYEIAAERAGKQRWADKNPENVRHIRHWNRLLSGNLHFIMMIRHPFDIAASMEEIAMDRAISPSLEGKARHIRNYIEAGLAFSDAFPDRSTVVRYEDLVGGTERTLTTMLARAGEQFEPAMLTGIGSDAHGRGLEDPKTRHRDEVSAENVGRWRRDLNAEQTSFLRRELGDLLDRMGYSV